MTNPFQKILHFIFYFTISTGLSIWGYYYFKDSPFKRQMASLQLINSPYHCPDSPLKKLYQQCIRPKIAKLSKTASPLEILEISNLLKSYYNQDLIQGSEYLNQSHMAYIINQVIFYESLHSFSIRRNSVDFFQIIALPYFKWKLEQNLVTVKKNMESIITNLDHNQLSPIDQRYLEKFNQLYIKSI